jgi:hypothetical protein
MSDSMKPDRTWHDIVTEMSAERDPQKMMRLATELFLGVRGCDTLDTQPISFLLTVRCMPDILSQDALSRR